MTTDQSTNPIIANSQQVPNSGPIWINQQQLNQRSEYGPVLCLNKSTLYIAWTGNDLIVPFGGNINIMPIAVPSLKVDYNANYVSPNTCSGSPSIIIFEGRMYVAWTGTDANNSLNVMSAPVGTNNFSNPVVYKENSHMGVGPTIASFKGNLYLGWQGSDLNLSINIMSLNGTKMTLKESTNNGISLLEFQNTFFMAWADGNLSNTWQTSRK